ncbi:CgeB family protein [Methanomassiliicoccus luminyensis]|uniref:CgeB family protein n=1 Tax=Methanomassiliicoccus luminyensis TaxID=1080712 RepID=UPI00138AF974|nr:glycosyltransferase [Methanomassiliicoccus luminyensis]
MGSIFNSVRYFAFRSTERILHGIERKFDDRAVEAIANDEVEVRFNRDRPKVLYVGIRYDYGVRDKGLSFEHYNFYQALSSMDLTTIYFDYDRISHRYGFEKMSQMLREVAFYYQPDYLFYFHFNDWIEHEVWKEISRELPCRTIIWLADDHWRYEDTRSVWELFDVIATTDKESYEKRQKEGLDNQVLTQWGCNHHLYRNFNMERTIAASFVGRSNKDRVDFIDTMKKRGTSLTTFGEGWENGVRVNQSDLIRLYNQSKISLNISFASRGGKLQIKGRDFEAPGCGSLLVTKNTDHIGEYYVPGKEIVTYDDANDAADKIKYYLDREEERAAIAQAGYERTLKDHTMERRIEAVLAGASRLKKGNT